MIRYDFFGDNRITAAFSERTGGVSPLPAEALNLSFSREPGENRANVLANYQIAAATLGVPLAAITRMPQVHGSNILSVEREHAGMGVTRPIAPELAAAGFDGLITNVPGIVLSTTHADCTPVLLFDPEHLAVGCVHSGWKGTCLKIAACAAARMQAEFGTDPGALKAIIGPAISMRHFEVRRDVLEAFLSAFPDAEVITPLPEENGEIRPSVALITGPYDPRSWAADALGTVAAGTSAAPDDPKWHVDMRGFVKRTLLAAGLAENNIFDDGSCTFAERGRFFSHRRDGAAAGAMAAFIGIADV